MRVLIEEYGLFVVACLTFFVLVVVLDYFMTNSKTVARNFVANITGTNQSVLSDWDTWT